MDKQTCNKCFFENGKHSRACPYFVEPENPMKQNKNYISEVLEEFNQFFSPAEIEGKNYINKETRKKYLDMRFFLKQKLQQAEQKERERIIKIISLTGEFSIKDGREKFASEFKKDIINKIKELK